MNSKKPVLKMKKPEYVGEVEYHDLDAFINATYGLPPGTYEVVAGEEWNNYSSYTVYATKGVLSAYDQRKLDAFKASKGRDASYVINVLFSDLCNQGLLKPGKYLVEVSW